MFYTSGTWSKYHLIHYLRKCRIFLLTIFFSLPSGSHADTDKELINVYPPPNPQKKKEKKNAMLMGLLNQRNNKKPSKPEG
jgi:hypothetical protein